MAHTLKIGMQRFCDREAMNTAKNFISELGHYAEVNKIDVDQSLAIICCQYYLQKTFSLFDSMYSAKLGSNSTEQEDHQSCHNIIPISKDGTFNNKNITDIIKEFKQNALNFIRKDRQSFTPSLPVEVMRQGNVQFLTKDGIHQITKNTTNRLILAKSNQHYFLEIYCSNKASKKSEDVSLDRVKCARRAGKLENPNNDFVFVIELIEGAKFIVRCPSAVDVDEWVNIIQTYISIKDETICKGPSGDYVIEEEHNDTEIDQIEADVPGSDDVSGEIQQESTQAYDNPGFDHNRHENDADDVTDDSFYDIPKVTQTISQESSSKISKSLPTVPARPDLSSTNNNQKQGGNPYSVVKKFSPAIICTETRAPPTSDKNELRVDDGQFHKRNSDQIARNRTSLIDSHNDKTLPALPQESSFNTDLELYDLVPDRNEQHADSHQNDARTGQEHDQHPYDLNDQQFNQNQQSKAHLMDELEVGNFYDYPNVAVANDDKMQQVFQRMQNNPAHHDNDNIASNPHGYPSNNSNHKRPPVSTNPFINANSTPDHSFDVKSSPDHLFDLPDTSNEPIVVEENNYTLASPTQELTHRPQARNVLELSDNHVQMRNTADHSSHNIQTRNAINRSAYNKQTRNVADIPNNKPTRTGSDPRIHTANNQVKEINPKIDIKARSSSLSYEIQTTLLHCPCYFVNLPRTTAAQYCLGGQSSYSGTFLIRQSESSDGYALTFNCNGNIKHLRLTIDATGKWNIENFHFDDIFELMDFFRVRPIPFDKGRKESLLLERYPINDSPMDPPRRLTSQIIDRWRTSAQDHLSRV